MRDDSPHAGSDRVHVHAIRLHADDSQRAAFRRLLNTAEQRRADGMADPHAASTYAVARGVLRLLLSGYLGVPARAVALLDGPRGKPMLARSELGFNVSHSEGMALYAFASGCPVGVDIERIRGVPDALALARRFFHPDDAAALEALHPADAQRAFLQQWTRKEALLKASGIELFSALRRFPAPGGTAVHPTLVAAAGAEWAVHDLLAPAGYVATLAHRAPARELLQHTARDAGELLLQQHS